jgi:hypothetical protein
MRKFIFVFVLFIFVLSVTSCRKYVNVPPNDIGMILTPTGYEKKIYTPGMVDIGDENMTGFGSRLVLIQRSGIEVKEQFLGATGMEDKEDHRCLTSNGAPMTLDVRLLLALPDYEKPAGKAELERVFLLGNPELVQGEPRVLRVSLTSVYDEQARLQVRGLIRQLCTQYTDFDSAFKAFADASEDGFIRKVERAVSQILTQKNVPLRLVNAVVSNMKPDETVVNALSAKQAADKRVDAIRTLTDFLNEDQSGSRWRVYNMQALQEIVSTANTNGHNTIIISNFGGAGGGGEASPAIIPIPVHSPPAKAVPAKDSTEKTSNEDTPLFTGGALGVIS